MKYKIKQTDVITHNINGWFFQRKGKEIFWRIKKKDFDNDLLDILNGKRKFDSNIGDKYLNKIL